MMLLAYRLSAIEFLITQEPEKFKSFILSTKMVTCTTGRSKVVFPKKESKRCTSLAAIKSSSIDHLREKIPLQRRRGPELITSIKTIKNMANTTRELAIHSTPILSALKLTKPRAASSVWVLVALPSLQDNASTPTRILKSSLNTSMDSQILETNKAHWESSAEVAKTMHHAKTSNKMAPPSINIQISHLQRVEAEGRAPTPTRIRYKPATTSNCTSIQGRMVLLMCILVMLIIAMSNTWKNSKIRCLCEPAPSMARAPSTKNIWPWCKRRPTPTPITCSSISITWPKWQKLPSRRHITGSIRASPVAWYMDLTAYSQRQCLSSRTVHTLHHRSVEDHQAKCNTHLI